MGWEGSRARANWREAIRTSILETTIDHKRYQFVLILLHLLVSLPSGHGHIRIYIIGLTTMEKQQNSENSGTKLVDLQNNAGDVAIDEEDSPSHVVYYYGCGRCHPRWLQVLANAKFYTLILSLFILVEGAIASGVNLA